MLTAKAPRGAIRGHDVDVRCGQKSRSGGSSETLVSD
jgi:hypothetical protein